MISTERTMTRQDRTWWEQMRAKGRASFILHEGILRYGTQVGFAIIIWEVLFILIFTRNPIRLLQLALVWLVVAIVFGAFIGFVLWKQHEKDYHNARLG